MPLQKSYGKSLYILNPAVRTLVAFLLCVLLAGPPVWPQPQEPPAIEGYVTRVTSNADFDVNGFRVLCGSETLLGPGPRHGQTIFEVRGCPKDLPYVGEPMQISGRKDKRKRLIVASRIEVQPASSEEIAGSAVIDAPPVLNSLAQPEPGLLVRADGYSILISKQAEIQWTAPLNALAGVRPGDWIKYKGKMNAQGVVVASFADLAPNVVSKGEHKFREKYDYDPSAGFPSSSPEHLSEWYGNTDLKKIPVFVQSPMQARVTAVGNKLIPPFQRALPQNDPAKLHFHFQLVDEPWRGCMVLPGGVIFVPVAVVERTQNDSQLAAILAAAVADVLEKQEYRTSRFGLATAIQAGADIAAAYAPGGLGWYGAGFATSKIASKDINARLADQRGRVAFCLTHDAGYDIDQAPLAWWLLSSKKNEPIEKVGMPKYSEYLYQVLGKSWHNPAASLP